jgi:cyclohexa-1,5-dienecarbonyl-CoA hydratase
MKTLLEGDSMEEQIVTTFTPKHIVCKEQQGMFQIHLNRPPMNSFNFEMVEEINQALAGILYRNDLKLVVFSAAGKNFCGGFSPEDFSDFRSYQLIESFDRMFQQMQMLNIPILSVVQGLALGAGFELVIFSDLAITSQSSKFGFPEIRLGLIPALACNILQRSVPPKQAAELIFTGDVIDAKTAERFGLINHAVPDEQLQEHASGLVGKLLQYSAPILQCAKKAMTESQGKPLEESIRAVEAIYVNQLLTLEDSKEGIKAFVEKRKPVWKNQ